METLIIKQDGVLNTLSWNKIWKSLSVFRKYNYKSYLGFRMKETSSVYA